MVAPTQNLQRPPVREVAFRYSQNTMGSRGDVCGKLPVEIIGRVLSFLLVPVLCGMPSVCRTWNELISRPSFHDLCDLYLWRDDDRGVQGSIASRKLIFTGTFSFLDLDAMRCDGIQSRPPSSLGFLRVAMRLRLDSWRWTTALFAN